MAKKAKRKSKPKSAIKKQLRYKMPPLSDDELRKRRRERRELDEDRRLLDRAMGHELGFGPKQQTSAPQAPLTSKEWYMQRFQDWPKPPDMGPTKYARINEAQMKADYAAGKVLTVLDYVSLYKRHNEWLKISKPKSR